MSTTRTHPREGLVSVSRLSPSVVLLLLLLFLLPGGDTASAGAKPAAATLAPAPAASQGSLLVLHVYFRSLAERDRLASEFDAAESSTAGGYLTVTADQAGLDSLRQQGLRVEVDTLRTANVNSRVMFGNSPSRFYELYHTVEEMQQFLDLEAATYPTLAEKVMIGESWCKANPGRCTQPNSWNGFDLYAMHITNRDIPGAKPVFWFNSGIHAQEIAPPELAIDFIDYLLSGYETNADAHWLVDYHDIWRLPTLRIRDQRGCSLAGRLPRYLGHAAQQPRWAPYRRVGRHLPGAVAQECRQR